MTALLFIAGLIALVLGAELFVRGASRLAVSMNISPLIVGLTVVAFGTSAPELFISLKAAFSGQAEIAVGNVIGSNIFNVLFILGLSALIAPLIVSRQLIRFDVPIMIFVSLLALFLALDGRYGRLDGALLFAGLASYVYFLYVTGGVEPDEELGTPARTGFFASRAGNVVQLLAGLVCLVFGSQWFIRAAVLTAEFLGVSQLIIGLTIVSAGTSLPELVTSIVAALRGERDIAVGNVVGSNIFNILAVLGLTALIGPDGITVDPELVQFDIPFMIAVAVACLPFFFTRNVISRVEGGVLFAYYFAYTLLLILLSLGEPSAGNLKLALYASVVPLVVLTTLSVVRQLQTTDSESQQPH